MTRSSLYSASQKLRHLVLSMKGSRVARMVSEAQWAWARCRGIQIVHFLHIGKTGGTAVKHALSKQLTTNLCRIRLHRHKVKLRDVPSGDKVVFFVRDPAAKFGSGFYSRRRQGQPRYFVPWSPGEEAAFARFDTPTQLASALSSGDEEERQAACRAMEHIGHVKASYWDWFEDEAYFRSRKGDLCFIGFQERLAEDFERLKEKLGLPSTVTLPTEDVTAHRSPAGLNTVLEPAAIKNLHTWYAADYRFMALCRELASEINETTLGANKC